MDVFPFFFIVKRMDTRDIEILINKPRLTAEDKKAIRKAADDEGIEYVVRQGCRDCYDKLLLKLYEAKGGSRVNVSIDGYRFRDTKRSFRCNGIVYSNETIAGLRVGMLHPSIIEANFVKEEQDGR